jgi:hypothetical protein
MDNQEWMMPEFWVNQHAMDVIEHIFGPKPDVSFARSNVCLPHATGRQAVHADGPANVLNFPYMMYVFSVPPGPLMRSQANRKVARVANVFLCDVTPYVIRCFEVGLNLG